MVTDVDAAKSQKINAHTYERHLYMSVLYMSRQTLSMFQIGSCY